LWQVYNRMTPLRMVCGPPFGRVVTDLGPLIIRPPIKLRGRRGADAVVNSSRQDPVAVVQAFTDGRGADIGFECAGGESMPTALPQATRMVRRGGALVIVGGFDAGER
jgi:L-iditol 2-dehydrogenase